MKAFWEKLQPGQKNALMVLGAVLMATVIFTQVYEPLVNARDQARAEASYHQATLSWLSRIEPVIRELRANGGGVAAGSDQSLLALADQTARAQGLAGALSRIEPANDDGVSVWLDGARFDGVMAWLAQLSVEQGIRVERLSISQATDQAQVDVRVTLARQG